MAWPRVQGMRAMELATPGPFRLELIKLVLAGEKTATTGLLEVDYREEGEALEKSGERLALIGNHGEYVATIEITDVTVCRLDEVTVEHAVAEGEGWEAIEDWRRDHIRYWSELGNEVGDDTMVVCLSFRLLHDRG